MCIRDSDVMMKYAEKLLRKHPTRVTILAPLTTWFLTVLCGTGHVVYTMFPIIEDISLSKNIRPERPMAVSSVAAQMGITASPVSVAVVSMATILAKEAGITGVAFSIPQILMVSIPSSFLGVLLAAFWSLRRGKDLDKDPEFQKLISDPVKRAYVYGGDEGATLQDKVFPKQAYWAVGIFFTAIALVAGLKAAGALADNAARQSRVMLGQICAENALIELKLTRQFPGAGDSTLACEQAGQAFEVTLAVRATPNPNFRRVEAIVRQQQLTVVQVSTLIGRY